MRPCYIQPVFLSLFDHILGTLFLPDVKFRLAFVVFSLFNNPHNGELPHR